MKNLFIKITVLLISKIIDIKENMMIKKYLPKTFYAGLNNKDRLKMLVKHWRNVIVVNKKLEQQLKGIRIK